MRRRVAAAGRRRRRRLRAAAHAHTFPPRAAQAWDHVLPGWHSKDMVTKSAWAALGAAAALGVVGMAVEFEPKSRKDV